MACLVYLSKDLEIKRKFSHVLKTVNPRERILRPNLSAWDGAPAGERVGQPNLGKLGFQEGPRGVGGGVQEAWPLVFIPPDLPAFPWTSSGISIRHPSPPGVCLVNYVIAEPTRGFRISPASAQGPGPAHKTASSPLTVCLQVHAGPLGLLDLYGFPPRFSTQLRSARVLICCEDGFSALPTSAPPSSLGIGSSFLSRTAMHSPAIILFQGLA